MSGVGADSTNAELVEGVTETVDVDDEMAQWAIDNSRGGEFTDMLEGVRKASGALSVDARVDVKRGKARGGRSKL